MVQNTLREERNLFNNSLKRKRVREERKERRRGHKKKKNIKGEY